MQRLMMRNVFEAYTNSDLTEGRGQHVSIGHFVHESDAKRATLGRGVMGTDADVRTVDLHVCVYDTFAEFEKEQHQSTRDRALAKLSLEERRALGLV